LTEEELMMDDTGEVLWMMIYIYYTDHFLRFCEDIRCMALAGGWRVLEMEQNGTARLNLYQCHLNTHDCGDNIESTELNCRLESYGRSGPQGVKACVSPTMSCAATIKAQ